MCKKLIPSFLLTCLLTAASYNYVLAADTITLNVQNAEIRDVLRSAAALSGRNIVTDGNINGRISIFVENLPWQTVLDIITCAHGLAYRTVDGVIIVAAQENLFDNDKITVDQLNNTVLFTGSSNEEQRLRSVLAALDVPARQVTLEAKIISVNREKSENLGINWAWDTIPRTEHNNNTDSKNSNNNNFDGNFKFWHGYAFKFNATLNALLADGKAKILATPSIITIPGKTASIFIGDHIPVQTEKHDSSGTYTATEYLDAGIKLTYTPIVSNDGKMITANVHTEVSTPVLISEIRNYKITSRMADTNVRLLNGETLVIGGLMNEEEQKSIQKIPLLANIPLLGELFKNRTTRKTKTEVLMILTPHITEAGASPAIYNEKLMADTAKSQLFE